MVDAARAQVVWLDGDAPSPMDLLYHPHHDVYIVIYDDTPEDHDDACAVQILHASLAPLRAGEAARRARRRRGAPRLGRAHHLGRRGPAPAVAHRSRRGRRPCGAAAAAAASSAPPRQPNEHQPRGAISVTHVSDGDDGLLLGAIDGTVWVWRLYPAARHVRRVAAAVGAQRRTAAAPRLRLAAAGVGAARGASGGGTRARGRAAPAALLGGDAAEARHAPQPTITCVLHLRPDRSTRSGVTLGTTS